LHFITEKTVSKRRFLKTTFELCKYRVKIAQLYRLKSEQLIDVKVSFSLMNTSYLLQGKAG